MIEQAYTARQRSLFSRLDRLAADVRRSDLGSPAAIVIGDVVSVAPAFAASGTGDLGEIGVRHRIDPRIRAS